MFRKKNNDSSSAFTLAEVLITLGIIGVVAAMTISTLINNYQKSQTISQLKSTYSILNNAFETSKAENGTDANYWYIPNDTKANASKYFAENYLLPFLKTSSVCGASTASDCVHIVSALYKGLGTSYLSGASNAYSFTLLNGAIVQVDIIVLGTDTSLQSSRVFLNLDINGKKRPNVRGKDNFIVELGHGATGNNNKNKFHPYAIGITSRSQLLNQPDPTDCNKDHGLGHRCFALIVLDGWKIADDYPWD